MFHVKCHKAKGKRRIQTAPWTTPFHREKGAAPSGIWTHDAHAQGSMCCMSLLTHTYFLGENWLGRSFGHHLPWPILGVVHSLVVHTQKEIPINVHGCVVLWTGGKMGMFSSGVAYPQQWTSSQTSGTGCSQLAFQFSCQQGAVVKVISFSPRPNLLWTREVMKEISRTSIPILLSTSDSLTTL